MVGFDPDPEQDLGLDLIFALDDAGKSAAFEIAVICSRQNLKTGLYKMAALGWLFVTEERLVVWSAHEFPTSAEAFRDITQLVEGNDWLSQQVKTIYRGHGDESIELVTGQRLIFKTRTKGGGRGLTGDKVVLDEAMFLQPQHMGALLPTLSARPDPQVLYGASAGLAESAVLRGVRDRGQPGGDRRLAYLEWCDDLPGDCQRVNCTHALGVTGCRLDDERRWARSNPALGKRITIEYIAAERRAMPPAEFGRERLGWWDDPLEGEQPIDVGVWVACTADRRRSKSTVPTFFLDVSPGMRSSSIGVAFVAKSQPHGELAEYGPGTDWLVARAVKLRKKFPQAMWAAEGQGAVGALFPELEEAGLLIEKFTAGDMGRASGHLQKLVADKAMTHSDDPLFLTALAGAVKRDVGEGLWAWGRRKSTTDISPLVAVTGALWTLETHGAYDLLESVY